MLFKIDEIDPTFRSGRHQHNLWQQKMYRDLLSKTYTQTHFCHHISMLVLWDLLHFTEKPIKANSYNNSTEKWKTYMEKVWNLFCQSWRLLVVPKCQNVTFIPKTSFPIILSDSRFHSTISFLFKVILWPMFITLLSFTIVSNAFCNEIDNNTFIFDKTGSFYWQHNFLLLLVRIS